MTAVLSILAAALGALAGMYYEYYTGNLDHFMRRITRPKFPTPQRVLSDAFLDDCEQFNRAMLKTPLDQRVFEEVETVQ